MTPDRQDRLRDRLVAYLLGHGFAQLTVEDLARELRCSKSTLYQLAPSKAELVVLAVRHFFKTATGQVETAVSAASASDRIGAYLDAVAAALSDRKSVV